MKRTKDTVRKETLKEVEERFEILSRFIQDKSERKKFNEAIHSVTDKMK